MDHSFNTLFWLHKTKIDKSGGIPIYARITVNGKRTEMSTGKKINEEKWSNAAGRAKGNTEEARTINKFLDNLNVKLTKIHDKLFDEEKFISSQLIKDIYLGKTVKQHSLIELFKFHNQQIKELIGKGYAAGTLERFQTTLKHLREFIKHQYLRDDIYLKELNYAFITDFEFYLKTVKNIGHNTTTKYLRYFKKIVLLAVKNEWLDRDPFSRFKLSLKEVKKECLTKDELQVLENKTIAIDRLDQVRDIFVFCCYTGLAYSDVQKLTRDNLSKGMDGELWIFADRTKTGNPSNIPLLPKAHEIIKKYEDHPVAVASGKLLPIISNQKMNAYLKEIATLCGIDKMITFHLARHTFATTVTLANGVPIETVGSMLGHKNLRTTQLYAKVVQQKVSDDMKQLKAKFIRPLKKNPKPKN
jgi:site-specific recombinase XerD